MTPSNWTTGRARELRRESTDAERLLWRVLRDRQFASVKFRRQHPVGRFIVDFVCLGRRLVIELDGAHHADQRDYDEARTVWLQSEGYTVLRFSDREVLTELNGVRQALWQALGDPSP